MLRDYPTILLDRIFNLCDTEIIEKLACYPDIISGHVILKKFQNGLLRAVKWNNLQAVKYITNIAISHLSDNNTDLSIVKSNNVFKLMCRDKNHTPNRYSSIAYDKKYYIKSQNLDDVISYIYIAMELAIQCNHVSIVEYFISIKLSIYYDRHPICLSVMYNALDTLKLLIYNGARYDYDDCRLLTIAIDCNHKQIFDYLIYHKKAYISSSLLLDAVVSNNILMVEQLLSFKMDISSVLPIILPTAVKNMYFDIVKLLIKYGADLRICNTENVFNALIQNKITAKFARFLINNGVDLITDDKFITSAAYNGDVELFELLIIKGAQPDVNDNIPMLHAITRNNIDIAKCILKYKPEIIHTIKNNIIYINKYVISNRYDISNRYAESNNDVMELLIYEGR